MIIAKLGSLYQGTGGKMEFKLSDLSYEIEALFYQLFTWLAMYPKTLFKGFFRPGWVVSYVNDELSKDLKERFSEFLHPLIMWFFSFLVIMWSATPSAEDASGTTFEELLLSLILMAAFPIIFTAIMLRAKHVPLTRDTFQRPLYIQMMIFGVFQTLFGLMLAVIPMLEFAPTTATGFLGLLMTTLQLLYALMIMVIFLIPLFWFPIAEIAVLKKELDTKWYKVLGWLFLGLVVISFIIFNIDSLSAELDILSSMISIE